MRVQQPTPLEAARNLTNVGMQEMHGEEADLSRATITLLAAQAEALIAIAKRLEKIEDAINGVSNAVKDQDGFGPGDHLRHISDGVERIAKGH
jgi:hypothetical protein